MKNLTITLLLLFLPVMNLFAQVPPPPTDGEDAGTPGSPSTPIDQYLILLLLTGLFFGVYYLWKRKQLINA